MKDIIDKGQHCILDVGPSAVERLHNLHIFPVVIYVKFKQPKQLKELEESISSKHAKDLLDHAARCEVDYQHLFTAVIQGPHYNVRYVCQQIKCIVEQEQKKILWIPSKMPF